MPEFTLTAIKPIESADDPEPATGGPSSSLVKSIFCKNSGVLLATMQINIFEGHLAYLDAHSDAIYLHPFYRLSSAVLIKKLEDSLHRAQESGWVQTYKEQERLRLLTSAMMHSLSCLKQDRPTLPSYHIAVASAGRLLGLAKWFFYISSQRLEFPLYSISGKNENLEWQNFKHWIDSAYLIREEWASKSRTLEIEAKKKAHEESMKEVLSESYRRVDTRKVWNWIHIQLADHFAPGRLETFKSLFLDGDLNAHDWITDDIEDLKIALVQHCDIGNEIMHFINKRLDGIRAIIKDFHSSFTIINPKRNQESSTFGIEEQTPEEALFLSEYDRKVESLEELPAPPAREAFASQALFLKAQAQWNILKRRFEQKGK